MVFKTTGIRKDGVLMEIKLNVYCREDLEMQCYAILKQLEAGRSLKEIKDYIGG